MVSYKCPNLEICVSIKLKRKFFERFVLEAVLHCWPFLLMRIPVELGFGQVVEDFDNCLK